MSAAALHSAASQQASRLSSGREACSRCAPAPPQVAARWGQHQASRRCAQVMAAHRASQSARQSGGSRAQRRRALRLRPAAAAEAAEERAGELMPDRQGYRSFQLEGCEFLVAETPDGKLDLQDCYVTTEVEGVASSGGGSSSGGGEPSWRRPEGLEGLAVPVQEYQAVPWYSEFPGDVIAGKEAKQWVWRYYLVPLEQGEPDYRLKLDEVYMLDGKSAAVARCEVHRLAPADTPDEDLRLRIREDVVTVDTIQSLPDWESAVRARIEGMPSLSQLEWERMLAFQEALEEARKMGTIDEAEFEAAYDVHWLAGMRAGSAGVEALGESWEAAAMLAGLEDELEATEADVLGGWDEDTLKDLVGEYDEDSEEASEFEELDTPASDY